MVPETVLQFISRQLIRNIPIIQPSRIATAQEVDPAINNFALNRIKSATTPAFWTEKLMLGVDNVFYMSKVNMVA